MVKTPDLSFGFNSFYSKILKLQPMSQIWHPWKVFPIVSGTDHSITQPLHFPANWPAGTVWAFASMPRHPRRMSSTDSERLQCPCQLIVWKMERLCNGMTCATRDRESFPGTQRSAFWKPLFSRNSTQPVLFLCQLTIC